MKKSRITKRRTVASGKFLSLELLEYKDEEGQCRQWEAVQRVGPRHAAVIIAQMQTGGEILLIRQYRPALDSYVLEFPAGLIDPEEDAKQCALRELREETGYYGEFLRLLPPAASSAGLCSELLSLVFVSIDENKPENQNPKPEPQDGECIQSFLVHPQKLADFVEARLLAGDVLDSRLAAWMNGDKSLCPERATL